MRNRRVTGEWLVAVLVIVLAVGAIQIQSGARGAGFGAHPDEASHYMSGLMIRDYVANGSGSPVEFAERYYLFHPYFAIGVWPPLFYGVEAGWMLLFGHERASIILLIGLIAGANALLIFGVVRKMGSLTLALAMSILFLLVPSVRWSSTVVMTDLLVSFFALSTTLAFARFVEKPTLSAGLLTGLAAGLAMLAKYSAAFTLIPPVLLILIDRRWRLLLDVRLYAGLAVFAVTVGPWAYFSRRLATVGFGGATPGSFTSRLVEVFWGYVWDWGWMFAGLILATFWAFTNWRRLSPTVKLVALQSPCLVPFLVLSPPDIEPRYLMLGYASLVVLLAAAILDVAARYPHYRRAALATAVGAVVVFALAKTSAYRPLPSDLGRLVATDVVSAAVTQNAAILVPSHLEGPMIAELASAEPVRPGRILARPSKLFARNNWVGTAYVLNTPDLEALTRLFDAYPIDTVLLARVPGREDLPHDTLLRAMIHRPSSEWARLKEYTGRRDVRIEVYQRPDHGRSLPELVRFIRERTHK